jgi:sensor histidine kinase YesM
MVPPLLLNPIVENAIWHGILPLENDAQPVIGIKAVFDQITLKIEISDNGVGLKKTKKEENGRRSYGLEITEQRINNINYLLKSENGKVEIRDLHSEDELKQGVVVTIWLPIENRYE